MLPEKNVARANQPLRTSHSPDNRTLPSNADPAGYTCWLPAQSFLRQPIPITIDQASCLSGELRLPLSNSNTERQRIPACASARPTVLDRESAPPNPVDIHKRFSIRSRRHPATAAPC